MLSIIVSTFLVLVLINVIEPTSEEPFKYAVEYYAVNQERVNLDQFIENLHTYAFKISKLVFDEKTIYDLAKLSSNVEIFTSKDGKVILEVSFDHFLWALNLLNLFITLFVTLIFLVFFTNLESNYKTHINDKIDMLKVLADSINIDPTNLSLLNSFETKKVNSVMEALKLGIEKESMSLQFLGEENEIDFVSTNFLKLSSLLAVGFGLAGTKIIKASLASEGIVKLVKEGHRTLRICLFMEISNFTKWSERLKEKSIEFINMISEIIHVTIFLFNGHCIKNLGESFFFVWYVSHFDDDEQTFNNCMLAITTCLIKVRRQVRQFQLRYMRQLGYNQLPIDLRYGAHFGEAIEGPIGSLHKIDPSYLGGCVNITSRMCSASKQYGVEGLITNLIYDKLDKQLKQRLRLIDIVSVKGSTEKYKVFSLMIDLNNVGESKRFTLNVPFKEKKEFFFNKKILMWHKIKDFQFNIVEYCLNKYSIQAVFEQDDNKAKYIDTYRTALENYIYGNWRLAHKLLKTCLRYKSKDKAAYSLIRFINQNRIAAPVNWNGCRNLDMK